MAAAAPTPGPARAHLWTEAEGACDTREVVLRRDALSVTTDLDCEAVHGTWFSEYDGLTLHSEEQIDVDRLVPLANAWVSGGRRAGRTGACTRGPGSR
ncbi:hypothetical protein ACIBIZ_50325 [Nonomuraea spiralis]|uniref:hypothetical protein n=1 Tax=Nonomuraea spiralis TaxID=46182 RepID=UPI00379FEEE1